MDTNSPIFNNINNKYLNAIQNGIYVECGAVDGIHRSLTKELYSNGWSGFNFEPNSRTYNKLIKNRVGDINLNLCLSNKCGSVEFHIPKCKQRGFETGTGSILKDAVKNREYIIEIVDTITYDQFIIDYDVKRIDFMVLDVEGSELEVIERFSYAKIKPKYLLIETALIDVGKLYDLMNDSYVEDKNINVGWENKLFLLRNGMLNF